MSVDYLQVAVDSGAGAFVKTAVSETISYLMTVKWKADTDVGKDILEQFGSKEVVDKFAIKISKDILTFRSLSNAGRNVNLDDVYYPLTLTLEDNRDLIRIEDNTTIKHKGIIVISGSAGQGKTTILRKLFIEEIKDKNRLPIFINLREVDFENSVSTISVIKQFFTSYGIECTDESISLLMQSSKLVIFYDGFDEVNQAYRTRAREIIKSTWNRYNCQAIVTTRPHTEIYRDSGCKNCQVNKLETEDLEGIIGKISHSEKQKEALISLIKSREFLLEALIYPIMVDILMVSYYSMRDTPKTIKDFYAGLFRNLMYSHDLLKHFERHKYSELDVDELEMVFDSFSACTFLSDRYQFSERQIDRFFEASLMHVKQTKGKSYNSKMIRRDIIDGTNLISRDGTDFYTYIHKSIQEFHAAKFHIYSNDKKQLLRDLIRDNDSAKLNFLRFLYQISPKDFLLYYVVPYMRSLGFVGNYDRNAGYSEQQIINKLMIGSVLEFSSEDSKVRSKSITIEFGLGQKIIKSYERLKFLVGILQDIFNPEIPNGYLLKINLRRNPYVNADVLAKQIQSGNIKPQDFTIACGINNKNKSREKRLFIHRTELSILKHDIHSLTYIDTDYRKYREMFEYLSDFYKNNIMPYYERKSRRSKLKITDI
ncbi:NACHT domain-containing protein [Dryocola sp. BD626]|uniref:NACHT domain-containing protein n=1 Tax=Dryocola sp. BD626 TaxID=3133273 RepID=UPI003F4F550C